MYASHCRISSDWNARHTWSSEDEKNLAENYLYPLIAQGSQHFIQNVRAKMFALHIDNITLPIAVPEEPYTNSYVCSPYNQYITYAHEEAHKANNRLVTYASHALTPLAGYWMRKALLDNAVTVNNWLLSTNLYPSFITGAHTEAITHTLLEQWPSHALVWRSVNATHNPTLFKHLLQQGYMPVFSRQVFHQKPFEHRFFACKQIQNDLRLMNKSPYNIIEHTDVKEHHIERIKNLYDALYIHKYSKNNPQFTHAFFELSLKNRFLRYQLLEHQGKIDGVIGYYVLGNTMTAPVLGYDTSLPQNTGLYRILSTLLLLQGHKHGLHIHASAGAGSFKITRKSTPSVEYNMVYTKHLPYTRQAPWQFLSFLGNKIALPIVQKKCL